MHNLAVAYWKARKVDRAIPLIEDVVGLPPRKDRAARHPHTLLSLYWLGVMYTRFLVGPDFKPYYRPAGYRSSDSGRPADGPLWAAAAAATAVQLLAGGDYAAAEPAPRGTA